mgnify:CR=1 FL=1
MPVAITVFAFIATLWRGSIEFATPMLFSLGMLAVFLIGGVTGIINGSAPADIYVHDTYFVVAHFHYALIPPVLFSLFAGIYFWYPKMFGRSLNEMLGTIHFWFTFVFVNLTFLPQFRLGLLGHQRRIADPSTLYSLGDVNEMHILSTIGSIGLLIGQVPFIVNFFGSLFAGKRAARNPWRANTLEWSVESPPPHGNFDPMPVVYRGAYEYSRPDRGEDWWAQDAAPEKVPAR